MTEGIKIDEWTLRKIIVEKELRYAIWNVEHLREKQRDEFDDFNYKRQLGLLYYFEKEYERLMT
jgi:hypothetical protein